MKSGMQTYFFLASYDFRTFLSLSQEDPGSEIWDPEKFIPDPDPEAKKAPDPGSATLPLANALALQGYPHGSKSFKQPFDL
jgi:hypothetical protein